MRRETRLRPLRLSPDELRALQDRSDLREYFRRLMFHFPDLMRDIADLLAEHTFLEKVCRSLLACCAVVALVMATLVMPMGFVLATEYGMWGLFVALLGAVATALWATYAYFRRVVTHANHSRALRITEAVYRQEHWLAQQTSERNGHPANIPDAELEWLWQNIASLREWRRVQTYDAPSEPRNTTQLETFGTAADAEA